MASDSESFARDECDDQFLASLRNYSKRLASNRNSARRPERCGQKDGHIGDLVGKVPVWNPSDDAMPSSKGGTEVLESPSSAVDGKGRPPETHVDDGEKSTKSSEEKLAELIAQTRKLREAGDGQEKDEPSVPKDGSPVAKKRLDQLKKEVEILRRRRLRRLDEEKKRFEFKCNHEGSSVPDPLVVQCFMETKRIERRFLERKEKEQRSEENQRRLQMLKELGERSEKLRLLSLNPERLKVSQPEEKKEVEKRPVFKKRSSSVPNQSTVDGRGASDVAAEKPFERELHRSDERIRGLALSLSDRLAKEGPGYLEKLRVFYKLRDSACLPEPPIMPVARRRERMGISSCEDFRDRETPKNNEGQGGRLSNTAGVVFYAGVEPELSGGELSDSETGADISLQIYRESIAEPASKVAPDVENRAVPSRSTSEDPSPVGKPVVDGLNHVSGAEIRRALLKSLSRGEERETFAGSSEFGLVEALKCKLRLNPEELNLTGQLRIPLNHRSRETVDTSTQRGGGGASSASYDDKGVQATEMIDKAVDVTIAWEAREDKALQTTFAQAVATTSGAEIRRTPGKLQDADVSGTSGVARKPAHPSNASVFTRVRLPPPAGCPSNEIRQRSEHCMSVVSTDTSVSSALDATQDDSRVSGSARGTLGYGPRTLDMRFRTELAYLESLEESLRQLADLYRVHSVTGTKQDNIALAEIVQMRQRELLPLMQAEQQRRDSVENKKQALELEARQLQESIARAAREMENVQRETRALLAQSADKMTETQAQIAKATSEAVKAIAQFGVAQQQQIQSTAAVRKDAEVATSAAVSAAIKTAMQHLKESHKIIHGHSSVSSLSEDTLASVQESNHSSAEVKSSGAAADEPDSRSAAAAAQRKQHASKQVGDVGVRPKRKKSSSSVPEDAGTEVEISKAESVPEDEAGDRSSAGIVTEVEENTAYSSDFEPESVAESSIAEEENNLAVFGGSSFANPAGSGASGVRRPVVQLGLGSRKPGGGVFTVGQALISTDAPSSESFVDIKLAMLGQQVAEFEARAQQKKTILKLKENAFVQSARAEVAELEVEKRNAEAAGDKAKLALLRKKRSLLQEKLKAEKARMSRLKVEVAAENKREREALLQHQHRILALRSQTKAVGRSGSDGGKQIFTDSNRLDLSGDSDKENRKADEDSTVRERKLGPDSSSVAEELDTADATKAGSASASADIVEEEEDVEEEGDVVSAQPEPAGDEEDTSAAVASSRLESVPEAAAAAAAVRHSRSHSDDSKARRGLLVPDLCRADLDRSYSASQLPTLDAKRRLSATATRRRNSATQGHSSSESSPGEPGDPLGRKAWRNMKRYEVNKRYLSRKEQQLTERRKNVEDLLAWRARLEREEQLVRKLEEEALKLSSAAASPTLVVDGKVAEARPQGKEKVTDVGVVPERAMSKGSAEASVVEASRSGYVEECLEGPEDEAQLSDSTIHEDVVEHGEESSAREVGTERDDTVKESSQILTEVSRHAKELEYSMDSFESGSETTGLEHGGRELSAREEEQEQDPDAQSQSEQAETEGPSGEESRQRWLREKLRRRAGLGVRVPLSPKPRRKDSGSGSDDSFTHSHTETSDAGSDVEGRIYALQEELKRRHREVERLKREAKRRYREKLRVKEQALKKQIETYDSFILQTTQELEQELSDVDLHVGAVKPQIKRPKFKHKELVGARPSLTSSSSATGAQDAEESSVAAATALVPADDGAEVLNVWGADAAVERRVYDAGPSSESAAIGSEGRGRRQEEEEEESAPDASLPSGVFNGSSYSSVFEEQATSRSIGEEEESSLDRVAVEAADVRAWAKERKPNGEKEEEEEEESEPVTKASSGGEEAAEEVDEEISVAQDESEVMEKSEPSSPAARDDRHLDGDRDDEELEVHDHKSPGFEDQSRRSSGASTDTILESPGKRLAFSSEAEAEAEEEAKEEEPPPIADVDVTREKSDDRREDETREEEEVEDEASRIEDEEIPESVLEQPVDDEAEYDVVDVKLETSSASSPVVLESDVETEDPPPRPRDRDAVMKAERVIDSLLRDMLASLVGELRDSAKRDHWSSSRGVEPGVEAVDEVDFGRKSSSPVAELGGVEGEEDGEDKEPSDRSTTPKSYPPSLPNEGGDGEAAAVGSACPFVFPEAEGDDAKSARRIDSQVVAVSEALLDGMLNEVLVEVGEIQTAREERDIVRPPLPKLSAASLPRAASASLADPAATLGRDSERAKSPVGPRSVSPDALDDGNADLLAPLAPGSPAPAPAPRPMGVRRKSADDSLLDSLDIAVPVKGGGGGGAWIDDDLVLLEHEKLKEKQAQIEHEIQELEALQQLQQLQQQSSGPFFLREIPNKPPPPYTPPKSSSLSSSSSPPSVSTSTSASTPTSGSVPGSPSPRIGRGHRHAHGGHRLSKADLARLAHEACRVIPVFREEHEAYLGRAAEFIFCAHAKGSDIEALSAPGSFFGLRETGDDPDAVLRRCYVEMLFDLAKEVSVERLTADRGAQRPGYMKPKLVSKRPWLVPRTVEELRSVVCRVGLRHLGFEPVPARDRFVIEWTKKKKDNVDRILVRELQSEEAAWTDFEEEEVFIKNKLAHAIFDSLVSELVAELRALRSKRLRAGSSASSSSSSPDFPQQ